MKIYINERYEICALNDTDRNDLEEIEVNRDDLGKWCDAVLFGFKYKPSYEWDSEANNWVYNEKGNRVLVGRAFYPFIDYNIIEFIHRQYENDQSEKYELLATIVDNDYRLSVMELGLN